MHNHLKRTVLFTICLAFGLCTVSCRTLKHVEQRETADQTSISILAQKDTFETSSTTIPSFSGNKDFFWNTRYEQIPYQNGEGGITFEVLSNPFKLGDSFDNLGVRVVDIDPNLWISNYAPYLNLEKKINGEWVRLEIVYGSYYNGSKDEFGRNRRIELLEVYNVYHMLDCQIIPELTAGEYRFIAYIIPNDEILGMPTAVRQYYIPFEVVE